MEKFNLERALAGEPVITRDGREVTQLVKFDCINKYNLYGVVNGQIESFNIDGSWYQSSHNNDLFMKPKENAVWVNIYKDIDGRLYVGRDSYCSEADAKSEGGALYNYVKTIKIDDKI
jgi:hypothetical protein